MSITFNGSGQSVLQVVQATYAAQSSTSSTSFVNTGLSLSITPQSTTSKILIISSLQGIYQNSTGNFLVEQITRNGSSIVVFDVISGYTGSGGGGGSSCTFVYLDSPSTTSAISYVLQARVNAGTGTWGNSSSGSQATSTLTALEISGS
jgi:hypothetical protein